MKEKMFNIIHYTYGDTCGDDFYGKESRYLSIDVVYSTEQKVKIAVELLNKANHSFYRHDPVDEWDDDYEDEDYYYYEEIKPVTALEVLKKRAYKYRRK